MMNLKLSKEEIASIVPSLRRYLREELELDVSEMRAKFFLDYLQTEIAPYAYNQGVKDAEQYLRARVEELPATCFQEPLTHWVKKRR